MKRYGSHPIAIDDVKALWYPLQLLQAQKTTSSSTGRVVAGLVKEGGDSASVRAAKLEKYCSDRFRAVGSQTQSFQSDE
jgi:hypothetical protein